VLGGEPRRTETLEPPLGGFVVRGLGVVSRFAVFDGVSARADGGRGVVGGPARGCVVDSAEYVGHEPALEEARAQLWITHMLQHVSHVGRGLAVRVGRRVGCSQLDGGRRQRANFEAVLRASRTFDRGQGGPGKQRPLMRLPRERTRQGLVRGGVEVKADEALGLGSPPGLGGECDGGRVIAGRAREHRTHDALVHARKECCNAHAPLSPFLSPSHGVAGKG
jgi:hypothetical protein